MTLSFGHGDLIFIIGCFFLGAYNPLVRKFYENEPMEIMTFWILLLGSLLLLIISGNSINTIEWTNIPKNVVLGIIYLSLFSTLVTFYLIHFSTVRIGATNVAAYGFLTPLFVIIISWIIGLERFDINILPGLLIIVISMLLIQIRRPFNNSQSS